MKNLICIFLFVLGACKAVYVPNGRNSPMFLKAREVQVSVQYSNGYYSGDFSRERAFNPLALDFQSAVSVNDHLGFMGNYSFINNAPKFQYHRFGEAGIGYYDNTGKRYFEIFTGIGKGRGETGFRDKFIIPGPGPISYLRYFVQPAVA